MESKSWIGASIQRVDAIEKVPGKALYGTDVKVQGMLYGKIIEIELILLIDKTLLFRVGP
jgi:CO/xanthine dehydrogenase Mo-binding subunit